MRLFRTGNFIGCVGFHVATATITDILLKSKIHEVSDVSVVRYSDNTVLADTLNRSTSSLHVTDTSLIAAGDLAELRHAVDSCRNCTREKLIEIMENNFARCSTSLYTAYPVPLPPIEFDPDYQPEYLVITKISNHAYSSTDKVAITIENETLQISLVSFAIAALGMSVIFLILWFVSRSLTQPLLWIKRAAWNIVNHANDSSSNSISLSFSDEPKAIGCCVPATEISELVHQFKAMITGFSGEGSSSMAHSALFEIPNQFTWQSEFQQIYPLPSSISTSVTVRELPDKSLLGESERSVTSSVVPAPAKRNTGLNIRHLSKDSESANDFCDKVSGQKPRAHESSMFWWILLLIVIPLVLSNAAICWCVSARIIDTVDRWIQIASDESLKLELAALRSVAVLKSTQVQISIDVVRNHYVTTRFVGWLVFDGIIRSDAFTQLEEKAAQECRGYYPDEYNRICPFLADFQTAPCACQWQSLSKVACVDVNYTDARTLQETFFYCQARDYDNVTGNRDKASSFGPGVDDSPDATLWWDDVDKVPGAEKGRNASGFETTYDRVRVSSAMSVVEIPIYNYAIRFNNLDRVISINVAFQSDGMVTGYNGCNRDQAFVSTFQSNATNQAFEISPELCPEGKFGLDPRCTVWYSTGLSLYQKTGQALHISAPYLLAGQNLSAVSATSPIVNPRTGTYVGQTFFEFSAFSISQLLTDLIEPVKPIVFVVTPDNETGVDTFVGQSNFDSWESIAIGNILFPFEGQSSLNRVAFETGPLQKLKSGANDPVQLTRVAADGSLENLRLTLVPVKERVLLPLDPSDFSRGVNVSYLIVFWVGIAYREDEIQQPWRNIEVELDADLYRLRTVYLTIIATVSALFIMCACKVSSFFHSEHGTAITAN